MKRILSLLALSLFPLAASAENVDVTANFPSGTYSAPISIELRATAPSAKTFYSFNPDGGPQDAFLYTGAILLRKSTSLVFFSVVSTSSESKIKINEYSIAYPSSIRFSESEKTVPSDGPVEVSLVNDGSGDIDIGYWMLQSEAGVLEIAPGTVLVPGGKYDASVAYAGSSPIALRSPDGEERGILRIVREAASQPSEPEKTRAVRKSVPRNAPASAKDDSADSEAIKTEPLPSEAAGISADIVPSIAENPGEKTSTPEEKPITVTTEAVPPQIPVAAEDLKASIAESEPGVNAGYIAGFLILSSLLGLAQYLVRRRKQA